MSAPLHFFDLDPAALADVCRDLDLPKYAPQQLLDWVYRKHVVDPQQMTNIAARHRELIAEHIRFLDGVELAHQTATDGTEKILVGWPDRRAPGEMSASLPIAEDVPARQTECVMIPTEQRKTACISSQVGCPVGCTFCASGIGGLEGNLSRGRILEQVFRLDRLPVIERITNIVFMGMGEPLANFNAVINAIRTLNAEWGLRIGARRITLSTVGLPQAIRKLVNFEIPVTLALSLHAPNDDLRRKLIPWAQYTSIEELLDACDEYFQNTGREITLEYILLGGVNDQREHAQELASVAKRLRSNVNLIRYNEVKGMPYVRPETDDVLQFQEVLRKRGVNVHIRASRGRDIAAACGQLRHERRVAS